MHKPHLDLTVSPKRIVEIREGTSKETDLNYLLAVIIHGWPDKRSECSSSLDPYWNDRDKLTVAGRLILKGTQIMHKTACHAQKNYTMATNSLKNASLELKDPYSDQT